MLSAEHIESSSEAVECFLGGDKGIAMLLLRCRRTAQFGGIPILCEVDFKVIARIKASPCFITDLAMLCVIFNGRDNAPAPDFS